MVVVVEPGSGLLAGELAMVADVTLDVGVVGRLVTAARDDVGDVVKEIAET